MEDEATVSDYLEMLDLELRGISFVKMDHIRALVCLARNSVGEGH